MSASREDNGGQWCKECERYFTQPHGHRSTRARGDSRYDDEGYRYGVRFGDGSVRAVWNGRTQRANAEAETIVLALQYDAAETIVAVRKHWSGGDWETYR